MNWGIMSIGVSSWGSEKVLKLITVMVAQVCAYTKNYCIVYFECMNFRVCELYHKKAVRRNMSLHMVQPNIVQCLFSKVSFKNMYLFICIGS